MRNKIWVMVKDLIDERYYNKLCLFEGVKKYEVEIEDIVSAIESLAIHIEDKIKEEHGR